MSLHPRRDAAIRRCLEHGEPPQQVAADVGVALRTLQNWLRLGQLELELAALRQAREDQQQRHDQLVRELEQAAAALKEFKQLLDQRLDPAEGKVAD